MDKSIVKRVFKKYWKIALLATIIVFLFIPFDIIINKTAIIESKNSYTNLTTEQTTYNWGEFADSYLKSMIQSKIFSGLNIFFVLILPLIYSITLFKQLRLDKKFNDFKEIYFTHGILIVSPFIINAIILIFVKISGSFGDALNSIDILKWLGINILLSLFVYAFSNLAGYLTKNRITHILGFASLLYLPVFVVFTLEKLLEGIIFGYAGFSTDITNMLIEWPGLKIFALFSYNYSSNQYLANFGIVSVIVYLLLTMLLIGIFIHLSKKWKDSNFVTMFNIFSVMIIITSLVITAGTMMINNMFLNILIGLAISLIVYIIISVFLKKKDKKKLAISYGIYSIIVLVSIGIVSGNIFGYETKIPNIEDIDYAIFSTSNPIEITQSIVYKEKDNIQYIIDRQKEIVEKHDTTLKQGTTYYQFYMQYILKDGTKITRAYNLAPQYEKIYDSDEYINQKYLYLLDDNANAVITSINIIGTYNSKVFDIKLKSDDEDYKNTINAIREDIKTNRAYRLIGNEYNIYGEKDGVQYVSIDIATATQTGEEYVLYANVDKDFALIKLIQKYIDNNSSKITWEESE